MAEVAVRDEAQAARRADRGATEARGADLVGTPASRVPRSGEDLKRAGDVERLDVVEQDDQYCSHAFQSCRAGSWQQ